MFRDIDFMWIVLLYLRLQDLHLELEVGFLVKVCGVLLDTTRKMAHPECGETITHSVQILKEPLANDHVQSVPGKIPPTFVCIFPSMQQNCRPYVSLLILVSFFA
jgi:hypothetical protein